MSEESPRRRWKPRTNSRGQEVDAIRRKPFENTYVYIPTMRKDGHRAVGKPKDIDRQMQQVLLAEINEFLNYITETYGLELVKIEDSEGGSFKGVYEVAGYEYIDPLVDEFLDWQRPSRGQR